MVRRLLILSLTIYAVLGLPMKLAAAQQTGGILKFFHRPGPSLCGPLQAAWSRPKQTT
jgi:hypothetical protein